MKPFAFFLLSALPLWAQDVSKTDSSSSALDPTVTRELISQWVKTERIISEEKTNWQVEKQHMQELLDLYQKELKLLNEELSKAGASAEMVDEKKEAWSRELKEYREAQRLLADTMARLLPRMRGLIARLPEPLLDRIAADVDFLKTPEALAKPRDVLKSMLSVISESGRFNRTVIVTEEIHRSSDGKKMTVDVLYLGLARAFYASSVGDTAGIGLPGKDGWTWQNKPDLANDVRKAISVYRKDSQPQLIELPVSLNHHLSSK